MKRGIVHVLVSFLFRQMSFDYEVKTVIKNKLNWRMKTGF